MLAIDVYHEWCLKGRAVNLVLAIPTYCSLRDTRSCVLINQSFPQSCELEATSSSLILESLQNPVLVIDAQDQVVYANAAAAASMGGWVVGSPVTDLFSDFARPAALARGTKALLTSKRNEHYEALFTPMGESGICISCWAVADSAACADLTRRDDLTDLLMRNAFMAELQTALDREGSSRAFVAVLCLDLDRFKIVNDTLGHQLGDNLLRKVADRLRSACRKGDTIARLGGDEFVILQSGVDDPREAEQLAQRLVDLIGRTYVLNGHTVNIGVSVGVALATDGQARDLMRNADLALYKAKRAGRGRHRFFEAGMETSLHERRELEIDLRRALALKQFELHYQPFLDVSTDVVIGFEALLRWKHPVRGNVPPLSFISVAEENGLIIKIGEWVLKTACQAAASWPGDFVVAVNVSPVQFKADTLLATVASALDRTGLAPERLELEITEGALLDDTENVLATLHALRGLGVRISMDDFGTGYSSLSYLQKFPFNKIKIDRSFVSGADADSQAILRAVSGLGSNLGMAITAEGVETIEQLSRIKDQKCTHVQGYLTGKPMDAGQMVTFLNSQTSSGSR
jgi:diguanylate cyclase (GGDEF)-like protein